MPTFEATTTVTIECPTVADAARRLVPDVLDIAGDGCLPVLVTELDEVDGRHAAGATTYEFMVAADAGYLTADQVEVVATDTAVPLARALASLPAASVAASEVAVELLVAAGLNPEEPDELGDEVGDVVQSLLTQALHRCPVLLEAVAAMVGTGNQAPAERP